MAIAARTATYANNNSSAVDLVATEPSGAAENDVMFYFAQFDTNAANFSSGPTDWTLLNTWAVDNYSECRLYWLRRGSSALTAAQRTFTVSGSFAWIEAEISAYSGCVTSGNPWDDAQYTTQGDRSAPNPPSATSSGAGRYAVAFAGKWDSTGTGGASAPTNYTITRTGGAGEGVFSAYRAVGSGAEDPGTFGNTGSATEACSEATIILTPAGGAPASITKQAAAYYRMMRNR
jgi:hypothetical protein